MLLIYISVYLLGAILYYLGHNTIASAVIIALAIFLYTADLIKTKRIINIRGLFGLSFIGGFGLSLLKLSNLSNEYSVMTFIVVFASYFSLYLGAYFSEKKSKRYMYVKNKINKNKSFIKEKLPIILILVTFISFVVEAMILGFVPIFTRNIPHAYSTFHVFGLHYITTLYAFIPAIAICDYFRKKDKKKSLAVIVVSFIYIMVMSILLISRSLLITSLILSVFVVIINKNGEMYSYLKKDIKKTDRPKKSYIVIPLVGIVLFVSLYIVITISRAHDINYLNSIFDMKNKNMPIFITQPYMYIAHNYENLNYMINNIFRWTFGRKVLYPFFTLTLIKKFFPAVVDAPIFLIKEELSTKTLVYDFYYDFGLVGVIVFCFIIGYALKKVEDRVYLRLEKNDFKKNNYAVILLALFSYYMVFSFFQTYFSLTDTFVHILFLFGLLC